MQRNLYRHKDLVRALAPRSIAVVGASPTPGSLGYRTIQNLARFGGGIHLVNARHREILGRPCVPDLDSLPEVPDCVVLAIPREATEQAIEECARLGVGGAVIFASGYAEMGGEERIAAQQRLQRIARESGLRIIGPNCTGFANNVIGVTAGFAEFAESTVRGAAVGLITQSGALGLALSQAAVHGVSFSHVLTCGNSCDVDVADLISFLAEDPSCSAIACQFEGLSDPARLFEAAGRARSAGKPLIACKIGKGDAGRSAVAFHTATDPGAATQYSQSLSNAGAVMVDRFDALVETAAFFSKFNRTNRGGVAILSSTGGGAIIVADHAEEVGVPLPQPSEGTVAVLRKHIPDFGSARNPCDATAQATRYPDSLLQCAKALLEDPAYGMLLIPLSRVHNVELFLEIGKLGRDAAKPVGIVWLSQWLEGPGIADLEADPGLFVFRSAQNCLAAVAAWRNLAPQ
jgi:acyl-CoA synthetase (NDP forming)